MTWLTLLVRPATLPCRGEVVSSRCAGCPLPAGLRTGEILPIKVLDSVLEVLSDLRFDESLIMCPVPTRHPKLRYIAERLAEVSRRVYLMLPISELSSVRRDVLDAIDELVLITPTRKDLRLNEGYLKTLLSNGFDRVAIYAPVPSYRKEFVEEAMGVIREVSKYGLRIRVGEYLYMSREDIDLREDFRSRGYEVGLTYGYLYGYRATAAFINDYPVTLLTKPRDPTCRKLYISPSGRVSKCPFQGSGINVMDGVDLNELRRLIYSPCPLVPSSTRELIPKIEISLTTPDGRSIPPDVLALLEVISQVRSLRTACELLGVSPSTYIEKVRKVEKELGIKLVTSRRGGPHRGTTELTREAEELIKMYRRVRDSVLELLSKEGLGAETA